MSRSYDAIIIGGGVIGLSLAVELRKHLPRVAVFDKGSIAREASYAAAGMLNADDCEDPPALAALAKESARLYPDFISEIQCDSGLRVDFSRAGAIVLGPSDVGERIPEHELSEVEPELQTRDCLARFVQEDFVEPRSLVLALQKSASNRGIELYPNEAVSSVAVHRDTATGVRAISGHHSAAMVVNCAGAWAKEIAGLSIPTKPVKGQMISLRNVPQVRHVIRCTGPEVYMLPRISGALAIGATIEDLGFDKSTDAQSLQQLRKDAEFLFPRLNSAEVVESWAGLRPGTPDKLPILGKTGIRGYFVATGHYRSGILLAPITAIVMTQLMTGGTCETDLSPFAVSRFA